MTEETAEGILLRREDTDLRRTATLLCIFVFVLSGTLWAADRLLRPGDRIGITVLGEPELTKQVVISPEGTVTLPYVHDLKVAGMTATAAATGIAEQLKQFIKNPQVTVELVEPAMTQVTVSGEVQKPGPCSLAEGARLMDALAAAGGYTANADLSRITISRAGDSARVIVVDLGKFVLSGDGSANVAVNTGDTIVVPAKETRTIGTVMVLGAVRQSGQHPLTEGMTLREAVMLAGGPTEVADLSNITLRREGVAEVTRIDYTRAAAGDVDANPELKPGDVIFVAAREQLGFYTVMGAVMNPGRYELKGKTTLTEAIAIAGGVQERAKMSDVRILRSSAGTNQTLNANLSSIMAGQSENIVIQNGDSVYVGAEKGKVDYLRILSLAISLAWLLSDR